MSELVHWINLYWESLMEAWSDRFYVRLKARSSAKCWAGVRFGMSLHCVVSIISVTSIKFVHLVPISATQTQTPTVPIAKETCWSGLPQDLIVDAANERYAKSQFLEKLNFGLWLFDRSGQQIWTIKRSIIFVLTVWQLFVSLWIIYEWQPVYS